MNRKNIILYECYDGVRFVLERSLYKFNKDITIHSSHWKNEIKNFIKRNNVDLLITEVSSDNSAGLELSRYARESDPKLQIIWITLIGCHKFKELKKELGNIHCIEKPLEIEEFRRDVVNALELKNCVKDL